MNIVEKYKWLDLIDTFNNNKKINKYAVIIGPYV